MPKPGTKRMKKGPRGKLYPCQTCPSAYQTAANLVRHNLLEHWKDKLGITINSAQHAAYQDYYSKWKPKGGKSETASQKTEIQASVDLPQDMQDTQGAKVKEYKSVEIIDSDDESDSDDDKTPVRVDTVTTRSQQRQVTMTDVEPSDDESIAPPTAGQALRSDPETLAATQYLEDHYAGIGFPLNPNIEPETEGIQTPAIIERAVGISAPTPIVALLPQTPTKKLLMEKAPATIQAAAIADSQSGVATAAAILPDLDTGYRSKRARPTMVSGHGKPTSQQAQMINARADAIEIGKRTQTTEIKRPRQTMSPRAFCEAVDVMQGSSTNAFFERYKDTCGWHEGQRREMREKVTIAKASQQNLAFRIYRTMAFCIDEADLRPGLRRLKEECEQAFDLQASNWPIGNDD